MNVVLSMPELGHGGYIVYEVLGQEMLRVGDRITDAVRLLEASPKIMVPMFLGAAVKGLSQSFEGADPGWYTGPGGIQCRPAGLLVKHRTGALGIKRFHPLSQGVILALRDMTFRYACTKGNGCELWTHKGRHPASECVCGSYLDAIEKIFPTDRAAV